MALPVLASTLTTIVVFFPVTLLYGVSKFLFSALALAVVLSLLASYAVAMTVVPLFCAKFIKAHVTSAACTPVDAAIAQPLAAAAAASSSASTTGSTPNSNAS